MEKELRRKLLLKITMGQLRQLHELGFLSDKGKDFYIERLMSDEEDG